MASNTDDDINPKNLEPTFSDVFHSIIKGSLGAIPFVGSIFAESFSLGVKSSLQRRTTKFMRALLARLEKLEEYNMINASELLKNDEFLDVLQQTCQQCMKHSNEEKIKILQNVVLNTALGIDIQSDEKMMFLNIIDNLTPTHFKVLESWYNSEQTLEKLIEIYQKLIEEGQKVDQFIIPDDLNKLFGLDTTFYSVLLKDLETWNLLQSTSGKQYCGLGLPRQQIDFVMKQLSSTINEHLTSFGKRFMRFIMNPPHELTSET